MQLENLEEHLRKEVIKDGEDCINFRGNLPLNYIYMGGTAIIQPIDASESANYRLINSRKIIIVNLDGKEMCRFWREF